MKKQLLAIVALLATANLGYAISFDYAKYGFNIPAEQAKGLKVGDQFTITNVDPFAPGSTETLKDATGKEWARKLSSVFPGGVKGPGRGVQTYRVTAIPSGIIEPKPRAGMMPPAVPPRTPVISEIPAPTPQRAEIIKAQKAVIEKLPVKAPEKAVIRPSQPQQIEEYKFKIIEGLKPQPQKGIIKSAKEAEITTLPAPKKPMTGKEEFIAYPQGQIVSRTGLPIKKGVIGQVSLPAGETGTIIPEGKTAKITELPKPKTAISTTAPSVIPSKGEIKIEAGLPKIKELQAAQQRLKEAREKLITDLKSATAAQAEEIKQKLGRTLETFDLLGKAVEKGDVEAVSRLLETSAAIISTADIRAQKELAELSAEISEEGSAEQANYEQIAQLLNAKLATK